MVLYCCECVYVYYASNVATLIADRFVPFYVWCNKKNRLNKYQMFLLVC